VENKEEIQGAVDKAILERIRAREEAAGNDPEQPAPPPTVAAWLSQAHIDLRNRAQKHAKAKAKAKRKQAAMSHRKNRQRAGR
jgi:hypothetical protein